MRDTRDTRDMRDIIASDTDEGVYLEELSPGEHLEIQTRSRCYHLFNQGEGEVLISGHPEYCPEPVQVRVHGSTWGGSMLKQGFIGQGMYLEFSHPQHSTITTSRIVDIRPVVAH